MSKIYETSIRIGAAISKSFKGDTLSAAAALTKLAKATKDLKSAEKSAAAFKKLDGEMARAKSRYNVATEALRKLEEAEKAAGGATKESTKWRKAGAREVTAAARQLDRATKSSQKHGEVLKTLGVDTSKLATEQDRLTRALAATERQEKSLERYEHARERLFGKRKEKTPLAEKAKEQFKGIGESVLHLGEIGIGAGAAIFEVVRRVGDAGDATAKMAKRVGIGVEALQELRYAGERSGATIEDVDNGIGKLAINIGKWKAAKGHGGGSDGLAIPGLQMLGGGGKGTGGGETDPFKRLHLSAAKLSTLKPEQQVEKIADAMGKLKTDADRAAVAQAIFGREGGLTMIPMLKEGAAGLEKLRQQARATGGVLSKEATEKAEQFKDAQIDARLAVAGLVNTLGVGLLPVATETFNEFSGWAKKQDFSKRAKEISQWIQSKGIPAFKQITVEAQSFAGTILHVVEGAAQLTGGFDNLAKIVVAVRLAPLAFTLTKIAGNGLDAAASMLKFAAASRAAAAASGGGTGIGAVGKLGLGGTSAALGIGGAILGAGLYGIAKFEQAGEERNNAIENAGVSVNRNKLVMAARNKAARIASLEKRGLTHGAAVYYADHPRELAPAPLTMPRTNAGGGGIDLRNMQITVTGGSPQQVRQGFHEMADQLADHVIGKLEKKAAAHRRTSFAH
jgi:hypothetical protein